MVYLDSNRGCSCRDCIGKARSARTSPITNIHLQKMPELAKLVNTDLSRGFTVPQVAEKHACPVALADGTEVGPEDRTGGGKEPMVWSVALEGKDDLERFKELKWGLRTWDLWNWNDCLPREIFTPLNRSVSSV